MTEKKPILEQILDSVGTVQGNDEVFNEITALMALPDENFNELSEIVLKKLEMGLNDPSQQVFLAQVLNASGIRPEDLLHDYSILIEEINTSLSDKIGKNRVDFLTRVMGAVVNAIAQTDASSKRIVQIPIEICRENAVIPKYARLGDAGMDVYATEDYTINPGETKLIPLGIKVALPIGYELEAVPKSGMSLKTKLRICNSPGTIDSGYRDEIGIIIENIESNISDFTYEFVDGAPKITSIGHGKSYIIEKGQKFAQLKLKEVPVANFVQVDSVGEIGNNRGGGFGSTGLK